MSKRRALVTGAGRGIGAEIARELARAGFYVIVSARTAAEIEPLAAEIGGQAIVADMASPADIERLAATAGAVDVLVNNAGTAISAPLHKLTMEDWNGLIQLNLTGVMLCTQAFLPPMLEQGWGRVINVSSVAGLSAQKYLTAYAATKHAVIGMTRALADEVAAKGVTVNAVCPGFVDTPMVQKSVEKIMAATGRSRESALEAMTVTNPQGRLIESEEVAFAVAFLAHERARGINGTCLVIDGGGLRR
ncbi:MAG: SDR family oxidoreductase [Candidatus Eremiobacteraeota bacterium]|nr:SDR family oxidoreductase [Candidatus Eremiobacteraeota bacterium]MCW5865939.1 SDR family oxidoreductase [Candidatus Eremiobacteraeota bacterium]